MKMQYFVPILYSLVSLFAFAESSKILFLTCSAAPSHQKPFQVLWKELSIRGHEVHVLTPNPLNDPSLTNLTEYDISYYYEIIKKIDGKTYDYLTAKPSFTTAFIKDAFITELYSKLYNKTLHTDELKQIIKNNKHFDGVIVEWMFPTLGAFGSYYNAPLIGVTSMGASLVSLDTLGNPSHPVVAPDIHLPLKRILSFKEKLMSALYSLYVRVYYHLVILPREDKNIKAALGSHLPYIGDIERSISVLLMNRNPVFHRVMPLMPNTIDLGGIKFPKPKDNLNADMEKFIESSEVGTIYFSLGTGVHSFRLPKAILTIFTKVFSTLPYNVIWKWENDTMEGKPHNVYTSKWIPQTAVLEHPNVKLFITQGGLQSTEETIAAHKPIIGIPFHSDQTTNVDTCVTYGMGKMLELEELTEEKLRDYIVEIINNPSYAENAKKLDELMKDQPQDGLEKAVWWIEYVIRHKGAKHLRNIAVDLPWWQYLMLDVIGFILAVIVSALLVSYLTLKLLLNLLFKLCRACKTNIKRKDD